MKTQTLFTAFASAQKRSPCASPAPTRFDAALADEATLIKALRNSATGRDQIIQRRIGMVAEAATNM